MPYMPTNFYPKNQSIVKGELGFTNFYCLINKYDTIYKAVLRLYSYYDESVSYPKKVFIMETRDGEPWKYDTSSPGQNLYNDAEDAKLPFSTNEENDGVFSFSIANSDLETNRQMTWTLELYGDEDDYTVFIFDGKIQSASTDTVEVFASPLLQAGQKITNKLEDSGKITSVTSYLDASGLGVYEKGGTYTFNTPLEIDEKVAQQLNNTGSYEFQHLFIDIGSFTYKNDGSSNNQINSITFDSTKDPKKIISITLNNSAATDTNLLGSSSANSIELYSTIYLQLQRITYDTADGLELHNNDYFQILGNSVTSFENPFKIYEASNPSINLNIYNDNLTMTELDPDLFCGWTYNKRDKEGRYTSKSCIGLAVPANQFLDFSYILGRNVYLESDNDGKKNMIIIDTEKEVDQYLYKDGANRFNTATFQLTNPVTDSEAKISTSKTCHVVVSGRNRFMSSQENICIPNNDNSFHRVRLGTVPNTTETLYNFNINSSFGEYDLGTVGNIKVTSNKTDSSKIDIEFDVKLEKEGWTFKQSGDTFYYSNDNTDIVINTLRLDYAVCIFGSDQKYQDLIEDGLEVWFEKKRVGEKEVQAHRSLTTIGVYERDVNVDTIVKEFSASYFNKNYINWYQWKLYSSSNELIYEQERQFNKKLSNFIYDRFEDGQDYILEITIADRRGFTSSDKTNIHVKLNPYEKGAAPELSLDSKRKAIKIDWSKTIDLNANGVDMNNIFFYNDNGDAYIYTKQDLTYDTLGGQPMNFSEIGGFKADFKLSSSSPQNILSFISKGNLYQIKIKETSTNIIVTLDINGQQSVDVMNLYDDIHSAFIAKGDNDPKLLYKIMDGEDNIFIPSEENSNYVFYYNNRGCNKFSSITYKQEENGQYKLTLSIENESSVSWSLDMKDVTSITFHGNKYWKDIEATGTQGEVLMKSTFDMESLNFGGNISPANTKLLYYSLYRVNLTDDPDTYTKVDDFYAHSNIKIIRDYAVNSKNTYIYIIVPIFQFNDSGLLVGGNSRSTEPITPDWDEVTLLGTLNRYEGNNTSNIYKLDPRQNWHFELDVQDNNINFITNKADVSVNSQYPRKTETIQNFMSGSITTKLGYLQNDFEYMDDNIQALKRFQNFANQNYVKILRLRNGFVIPVDITLTSSANQNNLIGNPTDITFDWSQIADTEHLSLWEEVPLDENNTVLPNNNYYANNVGEGGSY